MNTIRRIALTAAAALCIATPAAQAANITVTHNGMEVTLECSEISIDGNSASSMFNLGCRMLCDSINDVDGWGCEFNSGMIVVDVPEGEELQDLLEDEQFTSDVVDAIDQFHALEASRSKPATNRPVQTRFRSR